MFKQTLFQINYFHMPVLKFKDKKKKLVNLLKSFPEKKHGLQNFSTNRQIDRTGLADGFTQIVGEELQMLSKDIQLDLAMSDIWSVSYAKGDYHSPHNHGSLGLSGILYLDMPEGAPVTHYIQPWNQHLSDTTLYLPMNVREGDIVILPSFINHFSPPNKGKGKKRIISWDMKPL